MYKGIRGCNDYLANVEKITPTDAAKVNRITSEVRTLRCYFYARLVSYFGDVPLVTTPIGISESKTLTRTPVAEIYDFIHTEITDAATYLPVTTTEKGRVTKGAALGILARTMLFAAGNVTGTDDRSATYYQRAKDAADAAGVAADSDSTVNEVPYEAIIDASDRHGCDLIFMASHGRRGIAGLLLGSETQKVLTHSKTPVLVYR